MDKECATVPYYVVESLIAVHKKQLLHLSLVFLCIIFIIVSAFVYVWTSYDYESSETTTVQQDGAGLNVYGSANRVSNVAEGYSAQDPASYP